ncbi:PREDICTED: UPF0389 protein CG9231 [Polistes dominula]|uniref:UPF0389 protein CG9231 n=1 Tax=Polistes dominula TaxID=743375 RepID=A0ABM1IFQ1_POLDO|nr:PREDICTED: UPF0389 protein CG9231 [Polistes dominula]XP_015179038.1 PREDICTED: UPF0389 protein CG9231 [Polistes dominula]
MTQLTYSSILSRVIRQVYCNGKGKNKFMSTQGPKVETKSNPDPVQRLGPHMYAPTNLDKRMLVWVKRYPSMAEIPSQVTLDCMLQARSKVRVRICNIMIVITLIGFLIAAVSGKKEVASGNTLFKIDQDWQKNLREEHAEATNKNGST